MTKTVKERVAQYAVETLVKSGMNIGLGTGSTAIHAIRYIGLLLKQGILTNIRAVSTSFQSMLECEAWNIPLYTLNSPDINGILDLSIDGADEVDTQNRCIKGGGGALLSEKIIAYNSRKYALIIDEYKTVEHLGLVFPVPIEIIPEARVPVMQALEQFDMTVSLREAVRKAGPVITDHGNIILDATLKKVSDPNTLELAINRIPGVIENGFFTRIRPTVFIGHSDTVEKREKIEKTE
ncbi:MAG: ribose-5-phosphate isomerase RpiA [Treponema sp.]|jgi:ribose 5-phosphate isomerase A|nr:ribose-5-phosphate isomerase RpiA [Treponema sp.]